MNDSEIDAVVVPQGEGYRDKFEIRKVYGEWPDEHVEVIHECYLGELRDIQVAVNKCVKRYDKRTDTDTQATQDHD